MLQFSCIFLYFFASSHPQTEPPNIIFCTLNYTKSQILFQRLGQYLPSLLKAADLQGILEQ